MSRGVLSGDSAHCTSLTVTKPGMALVQGKNNETEWGWERGNGWMTLKRGKEDLMAKFGRKRTEYNGF